MSLGGLLHCVNTCLSCYRRAIAPAFIGICGLLMAAGAAREPNNADNPPAAIPLPFDSSSDDGQWDMPAKNYASTRFSAMEEIMTANVANLKVAFTFSTGVVQGHEAAPLVVQNAMYIVTPYPNYLYALDLTRAGASVKWKYEPKPVSASQGVACCDVVFTAKLSKATLFTRCST